ncbi:Lrp1 protein [Martiniozyma asiatica (nom. inval.)]|nr:Lrp1 protein [Martiniozyma asiatica]
MEDVKTMETLLKSVTSNIDTLQETLSPLQAKPLVDLLNEIEATNDPQRNISKAQLLNLQSYLLTSLYFIYLKLQGENKDNKHPIMQDIARVKSYMQRVDRAEKNDEREEEKEEEAKEYAKKVLQRISGNYEPAVSKVHFEGKHTKFESEIKQEADADVSETDKAKLSKQIKNKKKNSKGKKKVGKVHK